MLIELTDIHREYTVGGELVRALAGVSIGIDRGEWVAIIGQSGSGKSTLMNVIGCLEQHPTFVSGWGNHGGDALLPLAGDAPALWPAL